MNNLDLITQILFKKYGDEYEWLTYNDLNKMISKFADDPLYEMDIGTVTVAKVRNIHKQIFPVIQRIKQVKALRSLDFEREKKPIMKKEEPKFYHELTPNLNYKTYHVLVDSKDRDIDHWPSNNPFHFTLGPSSVNLSSQEQANSIYRSFADVHSITIKKVIIPYTVLSHPYLLLVINELGSNISGTNSYMNNSFGCLIDPKIIGNYAYYEFKENFESVVNSGQENHMTKIFSPRIEVSRLTFNIQSPGGAILDFGNDDSVLIELQITCLRKELDNTLLLRPA